MAAERIGIDSGTDPHLGPVTAKPFRLIVTSETFMSIASKQVVKVKLLVSTYEPPS